MAKGPTVNFSAAENRDFAQQNTEQAMRISNYGMNLMREVAEQNLNQSKVVLESLLMITRKAIDDIDHQSSDFRQRSMLLAEETFSNAFDFAYKLVRATEPKELARVQSEFVSRQAQAFAEQAKELGQSIVQGANEMARATNEGAAEASRRRSEAA